MMTTPSLLLRFARSRTRSHPLPSTSHFATLAISLSSPPSTGTYTASPSPTPELPFLEEPTEEYTSIILTPRKPGPLHPPWPTLFAPSTILTHTPSRNETGPLPCDLVARLLTLNDLPAATQVRDELLALHTPIIPRQVYLTAATNCLLPGAHARESDAVRESLLWFSLWFSFPVQPKPGGFTLLRSRLRDYLRVVLEIQRDNPQFMEDLLLTSVPKGLADILIRQLIPHISSSTPSAQSFTFLNTLIAAAHTKYPENPTVFRQTLLWRNLHLRSLLDIGRLADGQEVFQAGLEADPPVEWSIATKAALLGKLQADMQRASTEPQGGDGRNGWGEYLSASIPEIIPETLSLPRQILRVSHLRSSQPLITLTNLLNTLSTLGPRPRLLDLLARQFIGTSISLRQRQKLRANSNFSRAHKATATTASFWYCAEVRRLQLQGDHEGAVREWGRRFWWVGLVRKGEFGIPREEGGVGRERGYGEMGDTWDDGGREREKTGRPPNIKLYPSKEAITIILPSLIRLLPNPSITLVPYHSAYLALVPHLPPALKPDELTHLEFVKAYAAVLGAEQAERLVRQMQAGGLEVGTRVWGMVGVAWAKERRLTQVTRIWEMMRGGDGDGKGVGMVPRTYLGPAKTLLRKKNEKKAMTVLRSMAGEFGEQGAERLKQAAS